MNLDEYIEQGYFDPRICHKCGSDQVYVSSTRQKDNYPLQEKYCKDCGATFEAVIIRKTPAEV